MKCALVLVTVVLFAANCLGQSHNQFWGTVSWNDTRVFNGTVTKNSQMFSTVTVDVEYPPRGVLNYRPISAIRAFDQKTNGNGAYANILAGGINGTSVIVRFQSIKGHGINFVLEIYTR